MELRTARVAARVEQMRRRMDKDKQAREGLAKGLGSAGVELQAVFVSALNKEDSMAAAARAKAAKAAKAANKGRRGGGGVQA